MRDDRLAVLIESYLDGTLALAERDELRARIAAPDGRREVARQVRLARALATTLAEPTDEQVWARVAAEIGDDGGRAIRLVAAVDARLDRPRPRRALVGALAACGAAAAVLLGLKRPWRSPRRKPAPELVRTTLPPPEPPAVQTPRWIETDEVLFRLDAEALLARPGAGPLLWWGTARALSPGRDRPHLRPGRPPDRALHEPGQPERRRPRRGGAVPVPGRRAAGVRLLAG